MNKGFSIITNFGCNRNCNYCIWRLHPLKNCFTTMESFDWIKLNKYIPLYDKISISGGGDPFFKLDKNWIWYEKLFSLYTGKIDVHTSNILTGVDKLKYVHFNRIVLHLSYKRFVRVYKYLNNINCNLRLIFVIDNSLSKDQIDSIVELTDNKYELSFKELDGEKSIRTLELEKYIQNLKVYFIKLNDYNIYFMPDNNIWLNFMEDKNGRF